MKNKRILIVVCIVMAILLIAFGINFMTRYQQSIGLDTDFNKEALRWAMIGAIGSWAGSIFGAFALVISLFAFWLPQKVKIDVEFGVGFMLNQEPGLDTTEAYYITVKNIGIRPVTVTNVYLHFGKKSQGDIFVGMLNMGTILQSYTPDFPKRLDQGESFEYYLLKDKLDAALAHHKEQLDIDDPLLIRVDEVTKGTKYYKTKFTLKTFLGHM